MGLIERSRAAWDVLLGRGEGESRALIETDASPWTDLPIRRAAGSGQAGAGFQFLPSLGTRKHARHGTWDLLQAYSQIPALRLCVDLLSGARARLEFEFYRAKRAGVRSRLRDEQDPRQRAMLRRAMIDTGDLEPLEDHPVQAFVRRGTPSAVLGFPSLTGWECRVMVGHQKLLTGESFTVIERRGRAKGVSKRGLPYGNIAVKSTDVSALPTQREPRYVIRDADGVERNVPMEDVLYRREPNPADIYGRGTGAAHALSVELEIDDAQAQHMANVWSRGTRPDLLIVGDFAQPTVPGGPFPATNAEAAARTAQLATAWDQSILRHKPVLFPGVDMDGRPNVTVHDLGRTMQDMEANAMRSRTWGNIAAVLGRIPPELRGETGNSNRATIEAAWYVLQTGTLLPMAVEECDFIRERIIPEFGEDGIEVDWISPVDRDWNFDLQVMTNHKESFTLDEKRSLAGKPEIQGGKGEIYLFTPGTVPVRDPSVDPLAGAGRAPSVPGEPKKEAAGDDGEPGDAAEGKGPVDDEASAEQQDDVIDRASHGLPLIPGEHEANPEAAFGQLLGMEGGEERGRRFAETDRRGVGQEPAESGTEGAAVEVSSLVSTRSEVNRAASYVLIDRIAAAMEPRLAGLFLQAVATRRGQIDEARLADALADGNTERALELIGADDLGRDLRRAGYLLSEVFRDAGIAASAALSEQLGEEVAFSETGTRVRSWGAQRSEDLAAWARTSAEDAARKAIEHGGEQGWSGAEKAGAVLLTFGLASTLVAAVLNHRAELQAAGEPDADTQAAGYRDDLVRHRGQMFGSDQAYSAAQGGQGEAWRQAKDSGKLPASARRYWVTRGDRRVCPECDGMHGQKRGLDEPFMSPASGSSYQHAGPFEGPHDGCRCALLIVGLRGGA